MLADQDIFRGSILENLTMENEKITMEKVTYLAEKTGLSNFIGSEEKGYDTILDPTGKRISKHIRQKIKLIRALAGKPTLLLLEDPLMDLAFDEENSIVNYLKNESNATIILISNDEMVHTSSNKVYQLDKGNTTK